MAFLKNVWYCAGWAEELNDGQHVGRRLLGDNILLFRRESDGKAAAMGNVCPHRFASLSLGPRTGDVFACPYHGLQFNADGECVKNPNKGGQIPKACNVPVYPLEEKWQALWIWMGDPAKADPDLIPDFSMQVEREGWSVVRGHHVTNAHYELVVDNLMDRTHVQFMHPLLQHQGELPDNFETVQSMEQQGDLIWDYHAELNQPPYPLLAALWPDAPKEGIESYFDVRWEAPGNMLLNSGTVIMGTNRQEGAHQPMANLITPVDENSTHYFWSQARDKNINNPEIDEKIKMGVGHTFQNEDGLIVADCAANMGSQDLLAHSPVLLASDVSAIRARRILKRLIDEELAELAGSSETLAVQNA
ncbi:MAG: Rieske 2Fe-2S domain-containing protein [Congregibacter sp.]